MLGFRPVNSMCISSSSWNVDYRPTSVCRSYYHAPTVFDCYDRCYSYPVRTYAPVCYPTRVEDVAAGLVAHGVLYVLGGCFLSMFA